MPRRPQPQRLGGLHVGLGRLGQHAAADDAEEERRVDDRDRDHRGAGSGAQHRRDPDGEQDRREREEDVHHAAQRLVRRAAEAGQHAERAPGQQRDRDGRAGDAQRDADAEEHAREQVAAEAVGAEEVAAARPAEHVARVHRGGRVGRDHSASAPASTSPASVSAGARPGAGRRTSHRVGAPVSHGAASDRSARTADPRGGSAP